MGKHLVSAFEKYHKIISVASKGGDIQANITSHRLDREIF
jgi:hypothetical protein